MTEDAEIHGHIARLTSAVEASGQDLDAVARRARSLHRRRKLAVSVSATLLLALVVFPLYLLSGLNHKGTPGPKVLGQPVPSPVVVTGDGLTLRLSADWDGRLIYVGPDKVPVIAAATVDLSGSPQDAVSTEDLVSAIKPLMGPDDLLLLIIDETNFCPCDGFTQAVAPLAFTADDFVSDEPAVPTSHALADLSAILNGRWLELKAEFGSQPVIDAAVENVNAVLASLNAEPVPEVTLGQSPPSFCTGRCWSQTPFAQWVRAVLDRQGLEVVGDTGSAFVASDTESDFYVWAYTARQPVEQVLKQGFSQAGTFDGVIIYSDGFRLVWQVQGLEVWIGKGPPEGSSLPSGDLLDGLVKSTVEIPYTGST